MNWIISSHKDVEVLTPSPHVSLKITLFGNMITNAINSHPVMGKDLHQIEQVSLKMKEQPAKGRTLKW